MWVGMYLLPSQSESEVVGAFYLFIYLLNIFKQGRTFRQKHCFTMLPCKEHLKIRQ